MSPRHDDERLTNVTIAPRAHKKLVLGRDDRLSILLDEILDFKARGIYGTNKDRVPDRYLGLHPDAAAALRAMEADYPGVFYMSDIFRNANGSRVRRRKNRDKRIRLRKSPIFTGKLPGSSAHGFGFSKDDAVVANMERLAAHLEEPAVSKEEYDAIQRKYGWICHRDGPEGDHEMRAEMWHYNYLGDDPVRWLGHAHGRSTAPAVEAKVQSMYGPFVLDADGIEAHLDRHGYRNQPEGIRSFQGDWTLNPDGIAGPVTQRVLIFVGAELINRNGELVDLTFPG